MGTSRRSGADEGRTVIRRLAAELVGTLVLVFVACGVATLSFGHGFNVAGIGLNIAAGVVATALAFGLTLVALVSAIGPISGCHVNPAVTIGAIVRRRASVGSGIAYMIAQFAGGILGALLLWWVFSFSPFYHRKITGLGADGYGSLSHIHIRPAGAFVFEVIATGIFVFVILCVTSTAASAATAGLVIGLTLAVVHLIGIPIDGTSVNPARSLGPALVVGGQALSQVWLFIVAPLIGGVLATLLHLVIYPLDAPAAVQALDPTRVPERRKDPAEPSA
jgi:aquaporin Z